MIIISFTGCEDIPTHENNNTGIHGVYILNEGNYSWTNASLSFFNTDSLIIYNHIFENANNTPLGDVGQSMVIMDSMAYIVLNNSGKIYLMNIFTNMFAGKITGLTSPRYISIINKNKAFVSDLYSMSLTIVNPTTMEHTGEIYLGVSSEQMLVIDNTLYVTSWSFNNKIFAIDILSDEVVDSLEVGLQPNSIVKDARGKLWVLCDGGFQGIPGGQERPSLSRINPETFTIEKTFLFEDINSSPIELSINSAGDKLYFINGGILTMHIDDNVLPEQAFISAGDHNFYGLGIDENVIYATDAGDYLSDGYLFRYLNNGSLLDSFQTGVVPGYIYFRPE